MINKVHVLAIAVIIVSKLIFSDAADIILFSDQLTYTGDSFGPSNVKADSMCYAISEETIIPPYSCANIFALLSYNSTYNMAALPSMYNFPTSSVLRSPTFSPIGIWSTAFSYPPTAAPSILPVVLTQSLVGAGILADLAFDTNWWTGTNLFGVADVKTCSSWSSTADYGHAGYAERTTPLWYDGLDSFCIGSLQFVCACITGNPTLSPTQQPTATVSPTKAPSKNPTINPTKSPVIRVDKQQVMYKIPKGSRARIYKMGSVNASYYVMGADVNSPINLTISDTTMIPVLWKDVYWLEYNQTTNSTDTKYTALCNPIANRSPGSDYYTFNEFYLCPTIYACRSNSISMYGYNDLQACILNKTVITRSDIPTVQNSKVTVSALDITAYTPTPITLSDIIVGRIRCNDFIDRTINCQLYQVYKSSYRLQCVSEDIKCYSYSQGLFFGGFWNANPFFKYDIPRVNWTLAHYQGIASTMNYYIYAQNGRFIDAFTSNVWTDYFWLEGIQSLAISQSQVFATSYTFQNDYIQGQEFNYLGGDILPPPTSSFANNPFSSSITDCIVQIIFSGSLTGICANQTWDNIPDVQWRIPSYIRFIPISAGTVVYSLIVETAFNYTGIELYNVHGELCSVYLKPTLFQNITLSCLQASSSLTPPTEDSFIQVRYFGVHSIWDMPNTTLSESVPVQTEDTFISYNLPFKRIINLLYSVLFFVEMTVSGNANDLHIDWPGRYNDISLMQEPRYFLNYTSNTSVTISSLIESVRQGILINNTYPYNQALATWVARNNYQEIPVDYNNPDHIDWLVQIWSNSMSPRQCTEFEDCMTSRRGKCIYPENPNIQYSARIKPIYWQQGDVPPGYTIPNQANEGGCVIDDDFVDGFYDRQLAGARCRQGYGPENNENWVDIQQYNRLISNVGGFEGSNCKLPAAIDPITAPLVDYNLCAGHGLVSYSQNTVTSTIEQFSDGSQWLFPLCTAIMLDQDVYNAVTVTNVFIQQFTMGNNILSFINDQVFLNGQSCLLVEDQVPRLVCSQTYVIQCISTFFFSHKDIVFSSSDTYIRKGLQRYAFNIGVFN